jgi:hypothetical protein
MKKTLLILGATLLLTSAANAALIPCPKATNVESILENLDVAHQIQASLNAEHPGRLIIENPDLKWGEKIGKISLVQVEKDPMTTTCKYTDANGQFTYSFDIQRGLK